MHASTSVRLTAGLLQRSSSTIPTLAGSSWAPWTPWPSRKHCKIRSQLESIYRLLIALIDRGKEDKRVE